MSLAFFHNGGNNNNKGKKYNTVTE